MDRLRAFVIGSKNLACRVLSILANQGHEVLGVLSCDDTPGMRVWLDVLGHRSLAQEAANLGIPVHQGVSINSEEMVCILASLNLDAIFCAFWHEIVSERVLTLPKLGCFNLHTAALPNNRGSFPMAWVIINGEEHAGLTIHRMVKGCDAGPIVAQVKVPIAESETGQSLYNKVTAEGARLFARTLPEIASGAFTLTPQNPGEGSYHPCGYPYGGHTNPYWDAGQTDRFIRALTFPPFRGASLLPPACLDRHDKPAVRVALGFDCDRPRGALTASLAGNAMAGRKLRSLGNITWALRQRQIPATFFICGQWLESMNYKWGPNAMKDALGLDSGLVEIGDHTYSHNVLKEVEGRPDKAPICVRQAIKEYKQNTQIIGDILGINAESRGLRTPLGHYHGLWGEYALLDKLKRAGVKYVSSDLRGPHDILEAPLCLEDGTPRQPYRYENGLLEIPSHGWHDICFSGLAKMSNEEEPPSGYDAVMAYYRGLIEKAHQIAQDWGRDYFLCLVMHPYDVSFWAEGQRPIDDFARIVAETGGSFCTYGDIWQHTGGADEAKVIDARTRGAVSL
jgi:methionyl-tRNA formyltransferase